MRIQILFVLFLVNLAQNTNGRKKLKLKKQQRKEVHFKSWSKSENRSWTKITRNGRTRLMKNATKRSTNNSKASEDTRKWDVVWEEARRAVEAASEEDLVISSHCFRTEYLPCELLSSLWSLLSKTNKNFLKKEKEGVRARRRMGMEGKRNGENYGTRQSSLSCIPSAK